MEDFLPPTQDTPRSIQPRPIVQSQQPLFATRSTLHRSNAIETVKSWSHLFRPSFSGPTPAATQPTQSQSMDSQTTFTFCQNRLLASTEDLGKIVQNLSTSFAEDKRTLEGMINEAKALIETARQENRERHDRNMHDIDGQLTSVRRVVDTVSDLNAAIMAKLGKVEGVLEKLVDMNTRLERRMDSMEKEWMVTENSTEDTVKTDPDETMPLHTDEIQPPSPKPTGPPAHEVVDLTKTSQRHSPPKSPVSPSSSNPNTPHHSSPGIVTLKYARRKPSKSGKSLPAAAKTADRPAAPRRQTRAMAKRKKLTKDNDWEGGVWDVGVNDFKEFDLKG